MSPRNIKHNFKRYQSWRTACLFLIHLFRRQGTNFVFKKPPPPTPLFNYLFIYFGFLFLFIFCVTDLISVRISNHGTRRLNNNTVYTHAYYIHCTGTYNRASLLIASMRRWAKQTASRYFGKGGDAPSV